MVLRHVLTLSQIGGHWSGFRQGVIQFARDRLQLDECSYLVRGSTPEAAAAAHALLAKDSFHFGRTSTVSLYRNLLSGLVFFMLHRAQSIPVPRISTKRCSLHWHRCLKAMIC